MELLLDTMIYYVCLWNHDSFMPIEDQQKIVVCHFRKRPKTSSDTVCCAEIDWP